MGFSFKATQADFAADFEAIAEGNYNVVISNIDDKDGKISLTLVIADEGEFKGRKIFDNIVYQGEEDKVIKGRKKFAALGKSIFGDDREYTLDDIHTKFTKVKTKNNKFNDKVYTNILFYMTPDFPNEVPAF